MKKRTKRIGLLFLVLILIPVLLVLIEHLRGSIALNSFQRKLAREGERTLVAEHAPKACVSSENGAVLILSASNQFKSMTNLLDALPRSMELSSNGLAITGWERSSWTNLSGVTQQWDSLRIDLDRSTNLIALLREGVNKPCYLSGYFYHRGFLDLNIPNWITYRDFQKFTLGNVLWSLRSKNPDGALASLAPLLELIKRQRNDRLVITELIRIAEAIRAFEATWDFLQFPDLTQEHLNPLQKLWEQQEFLQPLLEACELERAMNRDHFRLLKAAHSNRLKVLEWEAQTKSILGGDDPEEAGAIQAWFRESVYPRVWTVAWADQEQLVSEKQWQAFIECARLARTQSWVSVESRFNSIPVLNDPRFQGTFDDRHLNFYDRLRFLHLSSFITYKTLLLRGMRMETDKALVVTAIALTRFKLDTAKWPQTLSELIPKYLASLPIDRMDGQPLRYQEKGGTFLLYSVGPNGLDDGGSSTPKPGEPGIGIWSKLDVVWPQKASAKGDSLDQKETK